MQKKYKCKKFINEEKNYNNYSAEMIYNIYNSEEIYIPDKDLQSRRNL